MHRPSESLIPELNHDERPRTDEVASMLLNIAIRHQTLSREQAQELVKWDLVTIAEYLALLLHNEGFLTSEEVRQMLGDTDGPYH